MRKKFGAVIATAALTGAAIAIPALPASAETRTLTIDFPDSYVQHGSILNWNAYAGQTVCDNPEILVYEGWTEEAVEGGAELLTFTYDVDRTSGTVDISQLPGGEYGIFLVCGDDLWFEFGIAFARLSVTKVVNGAAPAAATFTVEVSADVEGYATPNPFTVEFPEGGGTEVFYNFDFTSWTIEETDSGGATNVEILNAEVATDEAGDYTSIVTNTFPETPVAAEDEEPASQTDGETAPEPDSTDEEAAPAVIRQPAFTG